MEELLQNLQFSNVIWQIVTPLIFSCFDVITGYIQSIINKNTDSTKMRNGLLHKCLIVLVLIGSFIIEYAFNLHIVSVSVCIYICIMEITSILENLKKAGLDFKFMEYLNSGKEDSK